MGGDRPLSRSRGGQSTASGGHGQREQGRPAAGRHGLVKAVTCESRLEGFAELLPPFGKQEQRCGVNDRRLSASVELGGLVDGE